MNSRERVEAALSFREPDRIPVDHWGTSEIDRKLIERFGLADREELLDHLNVDFRYIAGPAYIGPTRPPRDDGLIEDHWGVPRVKVAVSTGEGEAAYSEVASFPLESAASVEEIDDYPLWPSPDWFDYGVVGDQVARARETGRCVVFMGDRMNRCAQLKPAMYLRGVEQSLLDTVLNPEIAERIFERVAEFYVEYARRTLEAADGGIDIFFMGDDFGTQNGPFISPEMWRRFLLPGFRELAQLGKRHCRWVPHHTCGSVKPLIPDMIEAGLDILNPVQPEVHDMDRRELKTSFGDRLAFHGSISIQRTLPFGKPEDVRAEVAERVETLAPSGGFIFCTAHNIQADTPLRNVEALFEAYRELGRYGAG